MKKQLLTISCIIASILCYNPQKVLAQDLHFSQYFNNPLLVNPANTGFAPDVDWRAGVSYRNQYNSLTANPYKTMSAWGDAQLFNNRFDNGWVGIGGALLRDEAGAGNLTSTKAFGSIAYHQMLGLNYAFFPTENLYFNAGFSAAHINRPTESFFSQQALVDQRLEVRYTTFADAAIKIDDQWIVNPNAYVSKMGNAWEVVGGLNANYNLSGDGNMQLIGGLYYRYKDAAIPMVGFQLKDYKMTVSYDATTSSLGTYNNRYGAYELSLVKTGIYGGGDKSVKCPTVKF